MCRLEELAERNGTLISPAVSIRQVAFSLCSPHAERGGTRMSAACIDFGCPFPHPQFVPRMDRRGDATRRS